MAGPASPDEAEEVRIHLLRGFRVSIGPRRIDEAAWRLRKASGLVKLLALAPRRRLHREQIIDLLWPDLTPEAAGKNLRVTLHFARCALGSGSAAASRCLRRQGEWLALSPSGSLWTDVEAFEAAAAAARRSQDPALLRAALELYTGDLLPEDRYEDWAVGPREELRAQYLSLLVELARLHEVQGRHELAIQALEQVVTLEPAREEAHVALMRLYALAGRRQQALRHYQQLKDVLQREMGAEPDAASRSLYEDIRAGRFPVVSSAIPGLRPSSGEGIDRAEVPLPLRERGGEGEAPPHNLPHQLTSFIGRERERAEVTQLLAAARLLTLTGAGGCGKTRLALEVAAYALSKHADGIWFLELGPLADPDLVPQAVATALGVSEQPGQPLLDTLAHSLRRRQLLLILDNCEHLVEACAALSDTLLRRCPQLRILTTSRQPLGVTGELLWRVPGLALPAVGSPGFIAPHSAVDLSALGEYDAIRLFVERACLSRPGFALAPANAAAVAQICRRLDGMPLAIELAAAWVRALAVGQIAARLDDRFRLLTGGSRTAPPRQQTLRAAVDWSYDLLSVSERVLFNRLSVFSGGWTLEAAEAVCAGDGVGAEDMIGPLLRLVDKSLVVAEEGGGDIRYRLLETLREYAQARLRASSEVGAIAEHHATYYLVLAKQMNAQLAAGPEAATSYDRLERDHDNLRAALRWSVEHGEAAHGLRLGTALGRFWQRRGYLTEGRGWMDELLALQPASSPTATRARGLVGAGFLAWYQSDYQAARAQFQASLALWRDLGDARGIGESLQHLAMVVGDQGDYAASRTLLEEGLALWREVGDRGREAWSLFGLGVLANTEGDYTAANKLLNASLVIRRELEDKWRVSSCLTLLGNVAQNQGNHAAARALYEESLAIRRDLGDRRGAAYVLGDLGHVAYTQGNRPAARALFEESLALWRQQGEKRGVGWSLITLGALATEEGDYAAARRYLEESLVIPYEVGDKRNTALALEAIAWLAAAQGRAQGALRLAGAAAALRHSIGAPRSLAEHGGLQRSVGVPPLPGTVLEHGLAAARQALGEAAAAAAWREGQVMTMDQAVELAIAPAAS